MNSGYGVGLATRWLRLRFPAAAANTGMGDRLRAGKLPQYFAEPCIPTQPANLSGTGIEYWPKCVDALRLGSESMMAHSIMDKHVGGWQVKLRDLPLTRANLSSLRPIRTTRAYGPSLRPVRTARTYGPYVRAVRIRVVRYRPMSITHIIKRYTTVLFTALLRPSTVQAVTSLLAAPTYAVIARLSCSAWLGK